MRNDHAKLLSAQALTIPTAGILLVRSPDSVPNDPHPALIVTSWDQLPTAVKTDIMAMVRAAEGRFAKH